MYNLNSVFFCLDSRVHFTIAALLFPINYYFTDFGWYQFFSFPLGCLLATYSENFRQIYTRCSYTISMAIIGILYVLLYKALMSDQSVFFMVTAIIPSIVLSYISEGNSLIIAIALLLISGKFAEKKTQSRALLFLGKYSYEIFLIHGVFLVKYNPIIRDLDIFLLTIEFFVFLLLLLLTSAFMQKSQNMLYKLI